MIEIEFTNEDAEIIILILWFISFNVGLFISLLVIESGALR